jgi:hypothetical protein
MSVLEFVVEMKWVLFFTAVMIWGFIATRQGVKKVADKSDEYLDKIAAKIVEKEMGDEK